VVVLPPPLTTDPLLSFVVAIECPH